MDGFNFLENTEVMFDKVYHASPIFVRHFTKGALIKGLQEHGCGDVTEEMMFVVCKKVTPAPYLETTLNILDENRTTPKQTE
jgi:hypothetical protein